MNAEKIYTATKEAMDAYAEYNKDDFPVPEKIDESLVAYWERYNLHKPYTALYRLNRQAMEEMYTKSAKGSSKPSLSAVKRILKNDSAREALKKAWWQAGLWVVCDGYRLAGLKEAVPSIPTYDKNIDKYTPIDASGVWRPLFNGTPMEEIPMPDKAEVKTCILNARAKKERIPIMQMDVRYFNAQYFLDMVEILPNAKMYQTDSNPKSCVFFKDEDGNIGLLLPINPNSITHVDN